jgi:hypothetical protein
MPWIERNRYRLRDCIITAMNAPRGSVDLLWVMVTFKSSQQPQASHNHLLICREKQYCDPKHKAQWK